MVFPKCHFIEPTCDFPQERLLCASFGYKWGVVWCSPLQPPHSILRECSCPELGHGAMVVWRWQSLFLQVLVLVMGATGGGQWQCCGLWGGMAAGTTALTRMVQDMGRIISLMQPFLQCCSRSISAACFETLGESVIQTVKPNPPVWGQASSGASLSLRRCLSGPMFGTICMDPAHCYSQKGQKHSLVSSSVWCCVCSPAEQCVHNPTGGSGVLLTREPCSLHFQQSWESVVCPLFEFLGNSLNKFKFSSLLQSTERNANKFFNLWSWLLHCMLRTMCCP